MLMRNVIKQCAVGRAAYHARGQVNPVSSTFYEHLNIHLKKIVAGDAPKFVSQCIGSGCCLYHVASTMKNWDSRRDNCVETHCEQPARLAPLLDVLRKPATCSAVVTMHAAYTEPKLGMCNESFRSSPRKKKIIRISVLIVLNSFNSD